MLNKQAVGEEIRGVKFPVLDHGFVRICDWMGTDDDIEQAARVSYQKGTRKLSETEGLLRYLMRHRHSTPFECCVVKFEVKLPIFVERQWARTRTASWNEVSARYSELPEEYYVPENDAVRTQSKTNKQGGEETVDHATAEAMRIVTKEAAKYEFEIYQKRLGQGIARELARINLPLGTYTHKIWSINLHNLLHFLSLRMDAHAQWEIRQYANIIGNEIIAKLYPITWKAFCDYRLNAMQLTALDIQVIQKIAGEKHNPDWPTIPWQVGYHELSEIMESVTTNKREQEECLAKLKRLGLIDG
jgi:thymidylate synthase (FAD)